MIVIYHQTKTLISFWCRRGLNPRSLIQLSETLQVELIRTHNNKRFWLSSFKLLFMFEILIYIYIYMYVCMYVYVFMYNLATLIVGRIIDI